MRESLSPELQQAMTLDADGRYTFFIQQAVANGKLWILKDDSGCMLLNAEEEDAIPFWSDEELARLGKVQDYLSGYCKSFRIRTYWGTTRQFLVELKQRWNAFPKNAR